MISLSGQKSAALEVTVANPKGEDAYEAFVVANFPRSVTYARYDLKAGVSYSYLIISLPHMYFLVLNGELSLIAASLLQPKPKWI